MQTKVGVSTYLESIIHSLMMIARNDKAIRYRFWLNRRKNNVTGISDNDSPSAATVSCVDQLTAIACIGNDPLNWGRLWTDNGNDSVGRHDVAKADVD